jgi:5-methylcytosine-specific restriction protein A
MEQLDDLRPVDRRRVFDLVKEAGLDVSDWANFARGRAWAAANPKYCYEWAFVESGRVVVLNLWHAQLREERRAGTLTWSGNLRTWARRQSGSRSKPVWQKRAEAFDRALREAARDGLPIRVIVNDGRMRTATDSKPSSVQRRMLDPLPWSVTSYNTQTGQCTLTRGVTAKGSVDQFDVPQDSDGVTERVSVQGTVFVRDPALRASALRRANGRCEFCLASGFTMADGRVFLETHHVVPLSEGGKDSPENVAAVCANHHREAHLGSRAAVIREALLQRIRRALARKQPNKPFHLTSGLTPSGHSVRL